MEPPLEAFGLPHYHVRVQTNSDRGPGFCCHEACGATIPHSCDCNQCCCGFTCNCDNAVCVSVKAVILLTCCFHNQYRLLSPCQVTGKADCALFV